jgi:nitroreductase
MLHRRSIRHYSERPVAWELVENAVRVACSAPSGANQQPWTYVLVSDPEIKERMRAAIEAEEYATYARRASDEWLEALAPLGTDWEKRHITDAPYVAIVFARIYGHLPAREGEPSAKIKHYYVAESVGISVGFFLAALTQAGLATLTHTPNPMGVLGSILKRPENERCFVVIPIGYPADDARVPALSKKSLDEALVRL